MEAPLSDGSDPGRPDILHLFAALAQKECALISKRTMEASARARGVTLSLLRVAAWSSTPENGPGRAQNPFPVTLRRIAA
jgi:hypothetical protein